MYGSVLLHGGTWEDLYIYIFMGVNLNTAISRYINLCISKARSKRVKNSYICKILLIVGFYLFMLSYPLTVTISYFRVPMQQAKLKKNVKK